MILRYCVAYFFYDRTLVIVRPDQLQPNTIFSSQFHVHIPLTPAFHSTLPLIFLQLWQISELKPAVFVPHSALSSVCAPTQINLNIDRAYIVKIIYSGTSHLTTLVTLFALTRPSSEKPFSPLTFSLTTLIFMSTHD